MASKNKEKQAKLPTPYEMYEKKKDLEGQGYGLQDILRVLSLGMLPQAPRLPQQAFSGATLMGGGYPKGFSGYGGFKGSVNFMTLRQIAERSPMLSAILARKQMQISRYARISNKSKKSEVGFNIMHKREADPNFDVPEGFKHLCRECEEMLLTPWRVYWNSGVIFEEIEPTMSGFLSKVVDDLLVINRPAIELGLDPLGIPRAFGAIDGSNIVPTFAALKYLSSQNNSGKSWDVTANDVKTLMQVVSDKYKLDITEQTQYIYMLAGRPVTSFKYNELIVAPHMPTTDIRHSGYPRSLVERAIFIILAEILAMTANQQFFEKGSMSEVILAMKGNYQDAHVKDLTSILQSNMSGINGMFKVPLIATPGGADDLNVVNLKQNHRDMLFDFYIQKLTNLCCALFGMHPSEINEAPRAGDNTGGLNQASQTLQIGLAQEQGMQSHLLHFKTAIFDPILQRIDPDLTFEWDFGENEATVISLATQKASFTTVNERRSACGMEPISKAQGGEVIDNPFVQAFTQQAQQAKQQPEAQQSEGGSESGTENEQQQLPTEDKGSSGQAEVSGENPELQSNTGLRVPPPGGQ